jgi:hypothetical protein
MGMSKKGKMIELPEFIEFPKKGKISEIPKNSNKFQ